MRAFNKHLPLWMIIGLLFMSAAPLEGGTIAYEIPAPAAGNQDFGDGLGHDFIVNSPIIVTSLGIFDDNADGITAGTTLGTQIWVRDDAGTPNDPADDTAGALVVSLTFDEADPGTLIGSQRFKTLASPLPLPPGSYTVNSDGYNGDDMNGNDGNTGAFPVTTNDGGGLIQFVGAARFGNGINQWPANIDGGPEDRYGGPTFEFDPDSGFVEGDVDGNGTVDLADFEIIRGNFLEPLFGTAEGDLDFSNLVDLTDFRIWKNAAFPAAGGTGPVPEPASLTLLGMALSLLLVWQWLRQRS